MISLYNDTVKIEFQESVHRYKVNGTYSIGVSTVLNTLSKDLMDWAAYMAVEAFREATLEYLTTPATMSKIGVKDISDASKKAHRAKSQKGKDVGTIVHAWIKEEVDRGKEINVPRYSLDLIDKVAAGPSKDTDEEDLKLINENTKIASHCIRQWRKWCEDYDVEFIKTETIVHSKKLNYCGTFDILFKSKRTGKLYMGDYKTSEPSKIRNSKYVVTGHKPYPEHFVQISGYDYAHNEEHGVAVDEYMVIYLPKEGNYQAFTRDKAKEDRQKWEHLVHVYRWIDAIKKGK